MSDSEMRSGGKSTFDFLVITMKTDEGIDGHSFGFAGRGAEMAGAVAAFALKPFFLGKGPVFRVKAFLSRQGPAAPRKALAGFSDLRSLVESRANLFLRPFRYLPLRYRRKKSRHAALQDARGVS